MGGASSFPEVGSACMLTARPLGGFAVLLLRSASSMIAPIGEDMRGVIMMSGC